MTIGVFDSGVGGLWILKQLMDVIPDNNYIYVGDQIHIPYGSRTMEEIRNFSEGITNFLIKKGCKLIVVACNTASAASLKYLREKFPEILFVGMEPAVKPAVQISHTGKVGVLATPATLQGRFYLSLVEKFGGQAELFENTCDGLVEEIEKGDFNSKKISKILDKAITPMLDNNIDTIVLGCTHYPFTTEIIKGIVGSHVSVIDPAPAIARRTEELLKENSLLKKSKVKGNLEVYTTGDLIKLKDFLDDMFTRNIKLKSIKWGNNLNLNEIN